MQFLSVPASAGAAAGFAIAGPIGLVAGSLGGSLPTRQIVNCVQINSSDQPNTISDHDDDEQDRRGKDEVGTQYHQPTLPSTTIVARCIDSYLG